MQLFQPKSEELCAQFRIVNNDAFFVHAGRLEAAENFDRRQ
jgi:hypothetical protein